MIAGLIEEMDKTFEELGDMFFSWVGPRPVIFVRDADIAESVLNSHNCISKGGVLDPLTSLLGEGLFTMKGLLLKLISFSLELLP